MGTFLRSIGAEGLQDGLVAYFPMDEASGDPVDVISGDTMTKSGTAFTYESQLGTTGVNGILMGAGSPFFSSDRIKHSGNNFTASWWFDNNGVAPTHGTQFFWIYTSSSLRMNLHYRNTPSLSSYDGVSNVDYGNPTLYDDAAHNIVFSGGGSGSFFVFVDGIYIGTVNVSNKFPESMDTFAIGQGIQGVYGQLGVWDRSLTRAEIVQIYNSGSPIDLVTEIVI